MKEAYFEPTLQGLDTSTSSIDVGDHQVVLSEASLVDPGRYFDPAFIAMSFDIQEPSIGRKSISIFIPKSEESTSFKLNIPLLLDEYLSSGEIKGDYTTAKNAYTVIKDLNSGSEFLFIKREHQLPNAQYSINRNETKGDRDSKSGCTCWYWDTYVNGVLADSAFLGCNCACEDPTTAITCGGGGGGGTNVHLNNDPPDCESFPYEVNSGFTNRISGAHNVYFDYISFQWPNGIVDFEFEYHRYTFDNILYFTAPLPFTNAESANLTAAAISEVNDRLKDAFGHSGWGSNPSAVENFILSALNDEMSAWGGTAGLQSNGASGNQIGVYSETWLPSVCN
ncbi:hypothetical protein [Neolewinella antarctica]|uniref:Uncharacterized protein n=1 Tax=Neolewinella antarctica TaxID=442734 RepID=A0ABX0XG13_9BACT|nr:hypothetical protein [Neolewinella antarctica]NJC28085.1 hypothetical protein [Neolewinella antarctica]